MAATPRPTVLLADDHAIVRDGIAKLLADFGFEVIGTVGDGQALLEAAKRLDPDVIVTDISMPGPVNGLDAVARLPHVRCELAGEVPLVADVTATAFAELGLVPGATVWATVKASEVAVYAR